MRCRLLVGAGRKHELCFPQESIGPRHRVLAENSILQDCIIGSRTSFRYDDEAIRHTYMYLLAPTETWPRFCVVWVWGTTPPLKSLGVYTSISIVPSINIINALPKNFVSLIYFFF